MNKRKNPQLRIIKIVAWIGIILFSLNFIFTKFFKKTSKVLISPINNISTSSIQPQKQEQTNSKSLKDSVENSLIDAKGSYAIVVKNLKTGENYFLDAHKVFNPGSLYKLWVMATVYNQIQGGQIKEDEVLSQDVQVLNNEFDIDPENAELTSGTITLNVNDALEQMITISHNTAALLLTEKATLSSIANFLQDNNFNESKLGEPPQTTPYDIALFFEKLYKGQLANTESTNKMIELLKRQTLNAKLPKYLPEKTVIAHKTGEIDYLSHDGGIVFTEKGDYIIVIFSESDYPAGAEDRIAMISKAVYDYFINKKTNGKN